MISLAIERLLQYGCQQHLLEYEDVDYARNRLLAVLDLDACDHVEPPEEVLETPVELVEQLLDWAVENNRIEADNVTYRDLFDTAIMDCLMPRPSEVNRTFREKYTASPEEATAYFYQLSKAAHYIRTDRIAKNEHWYSGTPYGDLEITINLSKPEKDPAAIAAERNAPSVSYPSCLLCKENVGYRGRLNHPARQNHRIIPVTLTGEQWYFQYSPYVYYNEHAIMLSAEHRPMTISKEGFDRLLEFVEQYPHYFVGSNADLPIVGGSILSHDHFQGGHHDFPMAKAPVEFSTTISGYESIQAGIVHWPMSVIRLSGDDRRQITELAAHILTAWRGYTDEDAEIFAETNGEPHNTITPIARMRNGQFELDLVLRNNRTSDEHPMGIFHPHEEVHHIKKENIGLIEVMGLAVLPGRLQEELRVLGDYLLSPDACEKIASDERTAKHLDFALNIAETESLTPDTIDSILKKHVGLVFQQVLTHAGIYKRTEAGQEAFKRFLNRLS